MGYANIPEEELKNKVARDYFAGCDCTKIIGKVDFCVMSPRPISPTPEGVTVAESRAVAPFGETEGTARPLLWAEAKAGKRDVVAMFAQLVLTIGKARTFDRHLPPAFLGAFDAEKIAFVPYDKVQHLFYQNDFNWNVAPSDHGTKEFAEIKALVNGVLETQKHLYFFGGDDKELNFFIRNNLAKGSEAGKIQIDKNNFFPIYLRWLDEIKPLIGFDFEGARKQQILDSDFYLADLFVDDKDTATIADDVSVRDDLFVVFRNEGYKIARENINQLYDATIAIKKRSIYENFWKRYKRPPLKDFQEYIIKRRDLLVPQDVRERKGAFFTPKKWVELSQKYIADVLGTDWQEEYYVWDCAAGTGNLLAGLANKYNIYASTLDQADVNAMHERINNGANLLKGHVFQFDFLNDSFFGGEKAAYDPETGERIGIRAVKSKLPKTLQDILRDSEKRKKLVIYINPPYAEAGNSRTKIGTGENKAKTATDNRVYRKYRKEIGKASNELFAQFLVRIHCEIPGCKIANFSKLKNLQAPNFSGFRDVFRPRLEKAFLVPADTFDNVKGQFPIGFFVWDGGKEENFTEITADVYDKNGRPLPAKVVRSHQSEQRISQWIGQHRHPNQDNIGVLIPGRNDFQHVNYIYLVNKDGNTDEFVRKESRRKHIGCIPANAGSLTAICVYLAVHHCIAPTWLNDRDQFLWPDDSWEIDGDFHNDCLVFTLFHSQNRISAKAGINHWIPFTEQEVGAQDRFASSFMSDFIKGKIKKTNGNGDLFNKPKVENGTKCRFSPRAQAVFDAGRELWRYYHAQKAANANASLYDIREHFQGRNEKGTMNATSDDAQYTELIGLMREKLNVLADKIAVKVYEHGFLGIWK